MFRLTLFLTVFNVNCSLCNAQEIEPLWNCQISTLSGIETDTIDGEVYFIIPIDSTVAYDSWCGTYLPTGNWVGYYDSTHTQMESQFFVNKGSGMHGECKRWYSNGALKRKAFYDNGLVVQYDSNWYENGNPYFTKTWMADGIIESAWWFSNGNLKERYTWKYGKPYGIWYTYDIQGNIIREEDKGTE